MSLPKSVVIIENEFLVSIIIYRVIDIRQGLIIESPFKLNGKAFLSKKNILCDGIGF